MFDIPNKFLILASIKQFFSNSKRKKMTTNEWFRPAITELIDSYKDNANLYDPKHPLYFNKQARRNSLNEILKKVQKLRKNTTLEDVNKKIQSLRTQFGQEVQKIEKSKILCDVNLIYTPRVWWFTRFEFIGKYMKMRSDPTTPLSLKIGETVASKELGDKETQFYEVMSQVEENNDEFEDEEVDLAIDEAPPSKKRIISIKQPNIEDNNSSRTISYIISNDTNDININTNTEESQFLQIHDQSKQIKTNFDEKTHKRKCKAFGNYISTLMREITDDKAFFEVQTEILKIIERTSAKIN
ncbi:hypothetical protein PVAND_009117 [Polypedilum vanderplanki]|uniref:MADF domain-containing protein n=1 Tax=Polypedilum vanderplanki TaxID=319348 RepID=A0A9J6CCB0_POLVA|nr:hypothetical protein PVAND_009117 [Polypedilum vanderplanki]